MEENLLICLVGLPRSGKSTWAKQQSYPIVNPDSLRLAIYGKRFWGDGEKLIWPHAWIMVRSLFLAGHTRVIVDATNTTRPRRDFWNYSEWKTIFKLIGTDMYTCKGRAECTNDYEIVPIIEKMASEFQLLDPDEDRYENFLHDD